MVETNGPGPSYDKSVLRSPNRDFFKKYGLTILPQASVFLMRHGVSNLNETMHDWKKNTGFHGQTDIAERLQA